ADELDNAITNVGQDGNQLRRRRSTPCQGARLHANQGSTAGQRVAQSSKIKEITQSDLMGGATLLAELLVHLVVKEATDCARWRAYFGGIDHDQVCVAL